MVTVSEAITVLIDAIHNPNRYAIGGEIHVVVSAAEAVGFEKGKVEGAVGERERIRKGANKAVVLHDGTLFVDEDLRKRYAKTRGDVFIVPASVLAPKEMMDGRNR